jgi:hypothetical protein
VNLGNLKLSGQGRKEPFRIPILNLFEVTAEKRTLGILMLDVCLPRQRPVHLVTVPAQRPVETLGHLGWTLSEVKDPLGSPCWTSIKSEARGRHPGPFSSHRTKNLGPLLLEASAG